MNYQAISLGEKAIWKSSFETGWRAWALKKCSWFRRGLEHRARAGTECHALLIEPRGVINTGDAGGTLTAEKDVRI